MKQKSITTKFILIAIFILALGFGLGKINKAKAATLTDCSTEDPSLTGSCFCISTSPLVTPGEGDVVLGELSCQDCKTQTENPIYANKNCTWSHDKGAWEHIKSFGTSGTTKVIMHSNDVCPGMELTNPRTWLNCFLLYILKLCGFLLSVSATLFGWSIEPGNITNVLNNAIIYKTWAMVRDVLNIAFIMFLLFSAFATVFQIDKYSYKKILLMLVIMALLVNFSFPITRFIIDVSNMMMYYFIDALKVGDKVAGDWFVTIANKGQLQAIINPEDQADTTFLIIAVIFVFMLAVTFLTIAVLFVIRTIALAILIIFSSLAFVGAAVSPLSSYASDWWKKLFNYSFFGPIMIFMLYVATSMTGAISTVGGESMQKIAGDNSNNPDFISSLSFYIIPIIILWLGLGIAQSMSIAGASAVVGKAQNFMKGAGSWAISPVTGGYKAGKWLAGAGVGAAERWAGKGKITKFLIPRVYKEAYKQRMAIKDREAFEGSTGEMHDLFNKWLSRGRKEKSDYSYASHAGKVSKYVSEISAVNTNADYVMEELKRAIDNKQVAKAEAALKILAKENNLNEMMHAMGKAYGNHTQTAGPLNIKAAIQDILSKAGAGTNDDKNEFMAKELLALSETCISAGNFGLAGMARFKPGENGQPGQFIISDDAYQRSIAIAKFQNLESQTRQKMLHHNSIFGENKDGSIGEIDIVQRGILESFNEKDVDQMNRSRDDLVRQIKRAINEDRIDAKALEILNSVMEDNKYLKDYVFAAAEGKAKAESKKNTNKPTPSGSSDSGNYTYDTSNSSRS